MFIYMLLALFLPSIIASVLYSRDVIQKKPGQLGLKMHACNRMLDLLELESVLTFPGFHALAYCS
jgi:hypothetical protein